MSVSLGPRVNTDEIEKSSNSGGFVKSSTLRIATPENTAIAGGVGSVLAVLRGVEG